MKTNSPKLFIAFLLIFSLHGKIKAQYDLTFTVDTGVRMLNSAIPSVGHDTVNHLYYLFYSPSSGNGMVAPSTDGLTFGAGVLEGSNYEFDPRRVLLPNGQWRNYLYDLNLQQMNSSISNDGINFTNEPGIRYVPVDNDNNSLGVYDIYKMPDNSITMLYVGDLLGLNNARKAISTDSGRTFTRVQTNFLADSGVVLQNPGSSYVDIKSISLGGSKRRLISMRGGYGIYSFTSNDYGSSYSYDTILFTRAQASAVTGYNLTGMYDPCLILLDDGRYRVYFCGSYLVNSVMTFSIFSATSDFPTTTGITSNVSENEITIYPNPSNGKFTIEMGKTENGTTEIYNLLGEKVYSENFIQQSSIEMDLSEFQKGIYFVRQFTDEGNKNQAQKIVIQ